MLQSTGDAAQPSGSFVASFSADGRSLVTRPLTPVALQSDFNGAGFPGSDREAHGVFEVAGSRCGEYVGTRRHLYLVAAHVVGLRFFIAAIGERRFGRRVIHLDGGVGDHHRYRRQHDLGA